MLKYGETVCCREYLLLCSSVVFGFRNGTDAVVDFSFMEIVFVKGLQLMKIVLLRGFVRLYRFLGFIAAIELKNAKEGTGWGFDEYYVLTAGGAASGRCD